MNPTSVAKIIPPIIPSTVLFLETSGSNGVLPHFLPTKYAPTSDAIVTTIGKNKKFQLKVLAVNINDIKNNVNNVISRYAVDDCVNVKSIIVVTVK